MKRILAFAVAIIFVLLLSGCAVKTYVDQRERVDQELSGNRGVLSGEVPLSPRKEAPPKRTVISVDVEIIGEAYERGEEYTPDKELWGNKGYLYSGKGQPAYKTERAERAPVVEKPVAVSIPVYTPPPTPKATPRIAPEPEVPKEYFIQYTVKEGDSLSSIAARKEFYGDAGKWKRVYNANKDILKDPSKLKPGQVLRIPMGGEEEKPRRGEIK